MNKLTISDICGKTYSIPVKSIKIDDDKGTIEYDNEGIIGRIYTKNIISFEYT